jgi:type IV pilus assembly protein PilC
MFAYVAVAPDGKKLNGQSEAGTPNELRQRLAEQGYNVQTVKAAKKAAAAKTKSASSGGGFLDRFSKVKLTDLSLFCRQFSTMIDAGVSLVRCLDVLSTRRAARSCGALSRTCGPRSKPVTRSRRR